MPRGEIFLQMSVNYSADDKVRALSRFGRDARPARDLYVQMLCHCKENLTDGKVMREELGVLAYPDPPKVAEKHAEMLVAVKLAEATDYGWFVPGYLKRNPSKADVESKAAEKARKGREANHRRWHEEKGKVDSSCEFCASGNRSGEGSVDRSDNRSHDDNGGNPHRSEVIGHRSEVIGHRSEVIGQQPTPSASVTPIKPAATITGSHLLDEHFEGVATPRKVRQRTGEVIDELLGEGFVPEHVREALRRLRERNAGPGLLPDLVGDVVREQSPRRRTESERMFG